jgi:hypothetical protein
LSFKAAAWAIECDKVDNTNQKMVLIILADCHNSETGRCDPSIDFIAERALMSRRTVERCLSRLETLGLVARKQRSDAKGFKTSNSYILDIKHASHSRIDATENQETVTESMRQYDVSVASESRNGCVTQSVSDASHSRINQEYINQEVEPRYIAPSRFCPPDFLPNEIVLRTLRVPDGVCVQTELEKFKLWEFSRPKSDWNKAFQSWLLNAKPDNSKPNTETALKNLNTRIEEKYS